MNTSLIPATAAFRRAICATAATFTITGLSATAASLTMGAMDASGQELLVGSGSQVLSYDLSGNFLGTVFDTGSGNSVNGMAQGPDGDIYVATQQPTGSIIEKYDPVAMSLSTFVDPGLGSGAIIRQMAFSTNTNTGVPSLFFAVQGNSSSNCGVFSAGLDGTVNPVYTENPNNVYGLAADNGGYVIFGDAGYNGQQRLQAFQNSGGAFTLVNNYTSGNPYGVPTAIAWAGPANPNYYYVGDYTAFGPADVRAGVAYANAGSIIGTFGGGNNESINGLAVDYSSGNLFVSHDTEIDYFLGGTGSPSVFASGIANGAGDLLIASVPEPSVLTLSSLIGLTALMNRRRRVS